MCVVVIALWPEEVLCVDVFEVFNCFKRLFSVWTIGVFTSVMLLVDLLLYGFKAFFGFVWDYLCLEGSI